MSNTSRLTPCAMALMATMTACAELPPDAPPPRATPQAATDATVEDLLEVLTPAFDLDEFLNELARPTCRDGCEYCDVPPE